MSHKGLSPALRLLVVVETIVCFGPAVILLSLAVLILPVQFIALSMEPMIAVGPMWVITSVVAGSIGLGTLIYVLWKLFRNESIARPFPVLAGILVASLPLIKFLVGASLAGKVVTGLPILASVHILYLSWPLMTPAGKAFPQPPNVSDAWRLFLLAVVGMSVFIRPGWGISEDQLLEKRSAWTRSRPALYGYELWAAGDGAPRQLSRPHRVEVQGERVTSVTDVFGVGDLPRIEQAWTMDRVFDELLKAHSQGHRVRVRTMEPSGFVERAFIETGNRDHDWDMQVRDFRTQPGTASKVRPADPASLRDKHQK